MANAVDCIGCTVDVPEWMLVLGQAVAATSIATASRATTRERRRTITGITRAVIGCHAVAATSDTTRKIDAR